MPLHDGFQIALRFRDLAVEIFVGDQGDPEFWKRLLREVPMIDVVIDDDDGDFLAVAGVVVPAESLDQQVFIQEQGGDAGAFQ